MHRVRTAIAMFTLLLVSNTLAQSIAATTVPNLIRFSGTLKDAHGVPIAVTVGITFAIYKQQDGGAPVWMETQNVTPDADGQYSVLLGSTTANGLPADLFSQEERWLAVQVQNEPEQARILLVSVPYAFKAHEAETLAGKSLADFVLVKDLREGSSGVAVGGGGAQDISGSRDDKSPLGLAASQGPTNFSGSTNDQIVKVTQTGTGSGGAIVATTASADSTTAINGTITGPGVAIFGHATSNSAQGYGIEGVSDSTSGIGLLGFATAPTGSAYGLKGYASSTGGTGVRGLSTATTGVTYGVSGAVSSPSGAAVWGQATAANGGTGIWGQSQATTGAATGVLGTAASSSGTGIVATESATTGTTYGLNAKVQSPTGTAAWLQNTVGGPLILATTGTSSPVTKFSVDGNGNVNAAGTFTGNGAGLSGLQFSQLTGALGSSQFSGNYSSAVTLSNSSNVFYGDGSHLGGVVPGAGSPYYIHNSTTQQATSNFNISGNGIAAGTLSANTMNTGTTYQIGGSNVLAIGSPADSNLFVGVGAGLSDVPGRGQHNVFLGSGAGLNNTNGILNTFVGYQAGNTNSTGNYNTFAGYQAGYNNTTGLNNSFFGVNAGLANVNGRDNTFSGEGAGSSNTGGSYNTFIGSGAGFTNTSGSHNIVAGYQAGYSAAGSYNTLLGDEAGYTSSSGRHNTFVGYAVGYDNTTGSFNTFVGYQAGSDNTTGHDNTYAGWEAGFSNTTGVGNAFYGEEAGYSTRASYNTFYGFFAGSNNATGNNDIYIGNLGPVSGTESNAIRIGGDIGAGYGPQTAAYIAGIYGSNVGGDGVGVYVDSNGQLGTMVSSQRFKEQIADMGDRSSRLFQLHPVTFFYKPPYDDRSHTLQYGLIAEEVAKVYPEMVAYDNDGQPYTVKYQYLAPMLLNELQKQHAVVAAQQEQIKSLQGELQQEREEFQQRLSRLETLIGQTVAAQQIRP